MTWAFLADAIPLYFLYALLFDAQGLSAAQISALFAIWSGVGVVAEVPSGALADRWSRRAALVASGVLQAVAYVVWIALPGFPGFAAGFAVWGFGGALASGAFEALLYDGLAAVGAADRYATVKSRATAASYLALLPAAGLAGALFPVGGYALVGWVSVVVCLLSAVAAATLPEDPRRRSDGEAGGRAAADGGGSRLGQDRGRAAAVGEAPAAQRAHGPEGDEGDDLGYLATLRAGLREAVVTPPMRLAVVVYAVLFGLDGFEEYLPLLAIDWGVATAAVPLALLAFSPAGALGAALGERGARLGGRALAGVFAAGALALAASAVARRPLGLVAVLLFYAVQQLVIVVADVRLQDRITGPARATVTSVASLGGELGSLVVFGLWALGELPALLGLVALVALLLPRGLRRPESDASAPSPDPAGTPV